MFVKLRHQSHTIFPDNPSRFVPGFVIFEPMIDRNSCHPNVYAGLQRIAFRIEPQNRRMLSHSVVEQDHINVVVEVLFPLTLWFRLLQFAGQQKRGYVRSARVSAQKGAPRRSCHDAIRPNESLFQLERYGRQRRQMNQDRMFAAHPLLGFALNTAEISYVATTVGFAVSVDELAIEPGFRHT
jgi:hypothetical protein